MASWGWNIILRADLPISPCVEILWRLGQAHWHQGFATEAALAALHVGFDVVRFPEIVAFTVPSNARSRAVMERLGMQMDSATFEHPGVPGGHVLSTHCSYRMSYEEVAFQPAGRGRRRVPIDHEGIIEPSRDQVHRSLPVQPGNPRQKFCSVHVESGYPAPTSFQSAPIRFAKFAASWTVWRTARDDEFTHTQCRVPVA